VESWVTHGSRVVYENAWIRVREDRVTRPDGSPGIYGVVETRGPSVFVVALTDDDEVLLVTQERYTSGHASVELPAGNSEGDEPLAAARRELQEETGRVAAEWSVLGRIEAMNGICTEVQHVFLARGLSDTGRHKRSEDGITRVQAVPFAEALEMVGRGEIVDGQSISSLLLAALKLRGASA
jgi:8-oxo-dGTP pyrophosphatase MutT (NUDIX family)